MLDKLFLDMRKYGLKRGSKQEYIHFWAPGAVYDQFQIHQSTEMDKRTTKEIKHILNQLVCPNSKSILKVVRTLC